MQYQSEELKAMQQEDFSFIYITSKGCNVCKVLAPKVKAMARKFPLATFHRIELDDNPEAKSIFMAFAIPTFLVFSSGKELVRAARHINLREVEEKLSRYYQMIFQ